MPRGNLKFSTDGGSNWQPLEADEFAASAGDSIKVRAKAATDDTPEKDFRNVSEFWAKLTPETLSKGLLSVKGLATGTQYGFYIFAYTTDAKGDYVAAPYYSWSDSKERKEEPFDTSKMLTISKKFSPLGQGFFFA